MTTAARAAVSCADAVVRGRSLFENRWPARRRFRRARSRLDRCRRPWPSRPDGSGAGQVGLPGGRLRRGAVAMNFRPSGGRQHKPRKGVSGCSTGGLKRCFSAAVTTFSPRSGLKTRRSAVFTFPSGTTAVTPTSVAFFSKNHSKRLENFGRRDGHRQRVRQFFESGFGADDPHGVQSAGGLSSVISQQK